MEKEINFKTYEEGCPSNLNIGGGGIEIGAMMMSVAEADSGIVSTEAVLTALIDGGDTESLNAEVENSTPEESLEVYNELMNTSPYLSDTIVSSAIEKEDVLPNVMIRDIMVANPHTAKSNKLIDKLDERWEPLPDYMKAQIMQGKELMSIKEETESLLTGLKQKKARLFNRLARHYATDTLHPDACGDSLAMLLQNNQSVDASYALAASYIKRGNIQQASEVLATMPAMFGLQGEQLDEYNNMADYFEMLIQLKLDGKSILDADSAQTQQLLTIVSEGTGKAVVFSRNVLMANEIMSYEEPVILPDPFKTAGVSKETLQQNEIPAKLQVYPNPADDFVIVSYTSDKADERCTLRIINLDGHTATILHCNPLNNQFIVDTHTWAPGVYLISLEVDGKPVESIKFTVL